MSVLILAVTRLSSAIFSNIQDCDETFNYWEPLHYYLYNYGFKTWEYCYTIRSWFYIWINSIPALITQYSLNLLMNDVVQSNLPSGIVDILRMIPNKLVVFYMTRIAIGLCTLYAENALYNSLKFKSLLIFLAFSPGMFISSTSFLPNTFGMIFATLAFVSAHSYDQDSIRNVIIFSTIAGIWGWPFCLIIGLFYINQCALSRNLWANLFYMIKEAITSVIIIATPIILCDSIVFGKFVFSNLNLAVYNLKGGSALYGTEPWYFYLKNGGLNFNIAFVLAIFSIPVYYMENLLSVNNVDSDEKRIVYAHRMGLLLWFYQWLFFFSMQAHKEERFLYIVYPLICYNASICLNSAAALLQAILPFAGNYLPKLFKAITMAVFLGLSLARIYGNYEHYHAAIDIYRYIPQPSRGNVCIGKEWYRFPSYFHLPNGTDLQFVESRFQGLLPSKFAPPKAGKKDFNTCSPGTNDKNIFDRSTIVK